MTVPQRSGFEVGGSHDHGTPFGNSTDDIPIDPALSGPPLDPALFTVHANHTDAELEVRLRS